MIVRKAARDDLDALVRLNGVVQRLHAELDPAHFRLDVDEAEVGAFFGSVIEDPNSQVLLAESDAAELGYVWFERQERPRTPFSPARTRLYVHHIAIADAARRTGVGSALLAAVGAEAERTGVGRIVLDVWAANRGAQAFFEAAGFAPFNLVMAKALQSGAAFP
ncbi:MAG TPA: GNAT family N-acetyltransferase [Phenylobacterium sp.]|uniref:GNAT family N-acetyltransferase n=1 Tax=Phenylobacterium sp. TaxID=1871053 RepID=UPI002B46E4E7|nr:GNAT family N-acetyltransferase [Phenylobacterium sp.]HKR86924.1 GNAT family N-acetyltransferase [Phenylobacterium sp.]HKT54608.1 GNAT family N-acetyltransferase [Caulobacteraceae bacterium]